MDTVSGYRCRRQRNDCLNAQRQLDLMFVVDTSHYMDMYLNTLRQVIPDLVSDLRNSYVEARCGITTFNDKWDACEEGPGLPFLPNPTSKAFQRKYCARVDLPLVQNETRFLQAIDAIQLLDLDGSAQQDVLGGMLVTAANPNVGWRQGQHAIVRIMLILTDTFYHLPGDPIACLPHPTLGHGGICVDGTTILRSSKSLRRSRKQQSPLFFWLRSPFKPPIGISSRLSRAKPHTHRHSESPCHNTFDGKPTG